MSRAFRGLCVIILTLCLTVTAVSANTPPVTDYHSDASLFIKVMLLLIVLPVVARIALTCFSEWLIAFFFKIDKSYNKLIIITNVVSQLAMLYLAFLLPWINALLVERLYVLYLLVLGTPVVICEYLVYRRNMIELTDKECIVYTVVANLVSLILGLLLNYLQYLFLF